MKNYNSKMFVTVRFLDSSLRSYLLFISLHTLRSITQRFETNNTPILFYFQLII